MTYTIEDVKRLCPEFETMVHADGSFNMINFGAFLVPDSGPGLLLLTTRHQLAIARAALEKLARLGNEPHYGNSVGNVMAREALDAIARADQ